MAKRKNEEAPKGSPAWMATFSDLMNLLLCFFVLLFSMSTVDTEKFIMVIASLQSSFSILPSGGTSVVEEGMLISSGISELEKFDVYFNEPTEEESTGAPTEEEIQEAYQQQETEESEKMAKQVEEMVEQFGIQDQVEVDFNAQYVLVTLNGALLFDSGSTEVRAEALPLVDKIVSILNNYNNNIIEIEGHTDNVPMHSSKYEDNNVLSMYRALYVADYVRSHGSLNPAHIKSSGRGEYVPVDDNGTPEGRARNRRVEIKIFNSYNSEGI